MPPRLSKKTASKTAAKKSGAALEAPSAGPSASRAESLDDERDDGDTWTRVGGGVSRDESYDGGAAGALTSYLFGAPPADPRKPAAGVSYNDYMATHEHRDRRPRKPPDALADYEETEEGFAREVTLDRAGRAERDDDDPDFCTMSCGVGASSLIS